MTERSVEEYLDQQRWLVNNGLFTDTAKDNLYLYGTLVHKDVQAVDAAIDPARRVITYTLYLPAGLLKKVALYESLKDSNGLWDMWRLRRLLKREGNLNFHAVLNRFVRDFCGDKWRAELKMEDVSAYVDAAITDDEPTGIHTGAHQQSD